MVRNIRELFGIYPNAANIERSNEYKEEISKEKAKMENKFKSLKNSLREIKSCGKRLDLDHYLIWDSCDSLKSAMDKKRKDIIWNTQNKVRKKTIALLSKKRLEKILDVLKSSNAAPISLERYAGYYEYDHDCAIGDCDDGYESWIERSTRDHFSQAQTMKMKDKYLKLAISGDMEIRDNKPFLRINSVGLNEMNRFGHYEVIGRYSGNSGFPYTSPEYGFNIITGVSADEFIGLGDLRESLGNLGVSEKGDGYKKEEIKEYFQCVKVVRKIIEFINKPLGSIPYELHKSLVKYNPETGIPSFIGKI